MGLIENEEVHLIPIEQILENVTLQNIRTDFNEGRIRELADDIYDEGLINDLLVMEIEDPDSGDEIIELVAGARRKRAISYIRKNYDHTFMDEGVPCKYFVGDSEDADFANVKENIEREDVDDVDLGAWIAKKVEQGYTQTALAEKLHRSVQYVNFRYTFHNRACEVLKEFLREGGCKFTTAYEISKNFPAEEDQIRLVNKKRNQDETLTLEEARNTNPNKKTRPSKAKLQKILSRATICADQGSETCFGIQQGISYCLGLLNDEDMNDIVSDEEEKQLT